MSKAEISNAQPRFGEMSSKLIIIFGTCTAFALGNELPVPDKETEKAIGCYYSSGAERFPPPEDSLRIENIDPFLCTHLYYNFVGLNADATVRILDPGYDLHAMKRFNDLRKKNPNLKTLVTMGGSQIMSGNYTTVVNDPLLREQLADNVVEFVKKYDFNGIDIYWEYPAQSFRDQVGVPSDKQNFVLLLKQIRKEFDKEGFILTAACGASEVNPDVSYDIKGISKYVHYINLMTFDFHGTVDADMKVGHNTPLFASPQEDEDASKLNVNYVVNYWLARGAPAEKIVLGTAFYGISFTLADKNQVGRGAPFVHIGGMVPAYYEICSLKADGGWKRIFDAEQQVPYIVKGDQIIAYDDAESIAVKAEYVMKKHLGGCLMWTLDQGDFDGRCGEKFPLLKTLNRILRNNTGKTGSEKLDL
ncbi:acidic mammalian chitinase-like [Belonocnema kinseyi]|uniref:acidic mammalian chitinase-like n=1 Tax=Belonocnema kinseyi TaxID=2817044 RepID=UPI00143CDC70|nr:acidic mammalian chitinase-like [Belonocnema kinseyi]